MFISNSRWFFFQAPVARRRSLSTLRMIEVVEQRCLLSASSLIVRDASGNPMDPEKTGIFPHQIFPPVPFTPGASSNGTGDVEKVVIDTTAAEISKNLGTLVEPTIPAPTVEIRDTSSSTLVVKEPVSSVAVATPSPVVSSSRPVTIGNWSITITARPKVDASFTSIFTTVVSSSKNQSSLRDNLESPFRSRSVERTDQKQVVDSALSSAMSFRSTVAIDQSMPTSQTNATFRDIAAASSEAAAADSRAAVIPNQTMTVLAATTGSSEAIASSSISTTADDFDGPFPILETDRFGLLRAVPFSSTGTLDPFQAALTTYFSNSQMMGRYDSAAAKPAVLPQTPPRESDLVLTGKQGKRLAELPGETVDDFFRRSLKFLLAPSHEAEPEKQEKNKPNVPGNEGNVDPGTQPQDGKDSGKAPGEGSPTEMKEGSLTWAGLLLAAASGFRSLRNRRKQQRDAA